MSDFMPDPVLVLPDMESVRKAIADDLRETFKVEGNSMAKWHIKSLWLIELIAEIEKSGKYPYNADVRELAENRLGFPPMTDAEYAKEGNTISMLVYNAQNYKRSDDLKANGYRHLTESLLAEVGINGHIQTPSGMKFKVRRMGDGKLYAMVPRSRTKALAMGATVKIVGSTVNQGQLALS